MSKNPHLPRYSRLYEVGGIFVRVCADMPIENDTFDPKLRIFEASRPGTETVRIHHHFSLPKGTGRREAECVYRRPPWTIYKVDGRWWLYCCSGPAAVLGVLGRIAASFRKKGVRSYPENNAETNPSDSGRRPGRIYQILRADLSHERIDVYHRGSRIFRGGGHRSLALVPTDQIWLARVFGKNRGFLIHGAGVVMDGKGLLFVGHSGRGKSTMVNMLRERSEVLCDDRIIVRQQGKGFFIHGTWSHGEIAEISLASAPLAGIFFLEADKYCSIDGIGAPKQCAYRILSHLVRPLVTVDWWDDMFSIVSTLSRQVPCYTLRFDLTGQVVDRIHSAIRA